MIGNTESIERDWSIAQHYRIMFVPGRKVQGKRMCLAQVLTYFQKNPVDPLDRVLIGAHFDGDSQGYRWVPIPVLKRWMGVA